MTDCTTVRAGFPWAWRVITTLDDMVVGAVPMKRKPMRSQGSTVQHQCERAGRLLCSYCLLKCGFVAHRLTIPKVAADVTR